MRQIIIVIFCGFLFTNCSKVETTSTENNFIDPTPTVFVLPTASPSVETFVPLKAVVPKVNLSSEQKKNLEESLPLKVREILEKAEKFEILAEVDNKPDGLRFEPNRIAAIKNEKEKGEILEAFYLDASAGLNPSACYIPHHGIRATYRDKTVEVEICYQCHLFSVKSPFGKFDGGLPFENQKSEDILKRIIKNQSVEIK